MSGDLTLLAALAIGLAGSTHCIGMCGGIAGSLGMASTASRRATRLGLALAYNLGRIGSYTAMGALAGLLVGLLGIGIAAPEWGIVLRVVTGCILLAVSAHLLVNWSGLRRIEGVGRHVWRFLGPLAQRLLPVRSAGGALVLGMLWGWLPCGLVYTVLLAAAASGDPLAGAATMLVFGLGTLPAMTGATLFGQTLRRWLTDRRTRRSLGLLMLLFALWTLATPLLAMLHGGGAMNH